MTTALPPHPGPRPDEYEFPFAEAKRLLEAIAEAAEAAASLVQAEDAAAETATGGWEGSARRRYEADVADSADALRAARAELDRQHSDLSNAIAVARDRRRQSLAEIAEWERAMDAYRDAQREALSCP